MQIRKTAIVTGGAAGIGAGIARRFAEGGYAVAIVDIDCVGATRITTELGDQLLQSSSRETYLMKTMFGEQLKRRLRNWKLLMF